jgi:Putative Ig domain
MKVSVSDWRWAHRFAVCSDQFFRCLVSTTSGEYEAMKNRNLNMNHHSWVSNARRAAMAALAALVFGVLLSGSARAQQMSGALFTSDQNCNAINGNIYQSKEAVFINGGPDAQGRGLPDGNYYVMVTSPNGDLLGTSGGAKPVQVQAGRFVTCYRLWDIVQKPGGGQGFEDTTNPGCEYKVWVSQNPAFPNNQSKTDNFKVVCGPPPPDRENHPPRISVPGPQVIQVGRTLTFTVTATDQDHDAITLTASGLMAGASFNASGANGTFTFTPGSNQVGQYTVSFTATDAPGAAASGSVQITVVNAASDQRPGPPIISVPTMPISVQAGEKLDVNIPVTSPSNCPVNISVQGPSNATFDAATGVFSITPTGEQAGRVLFITFTASDCSGQTATATLSIIVKAAGSAGGQAGVGHVCVPVTKVFFDTTAVNGNCGFVIVSLMNEGSGPLNIQSVRFADGTNFRVEGVSSFPVTLQSAGVLQLKIMFTPKRAGGINDELTIGTDDPDQPTVTILLKGKGKGE